jgi:hypothetical protein
VFGLVVLSVASVIVSATLIMQVRNEEFDDFSLFFIGDGTVEGQMGDTDVQKKS